MADTNLTRRHFLAHTGFVGCSLAASPLMTPVSLAAASWDTRLIVIILRGGLDGLDAVQPYGDPAYAALRQNWQAGRKTARWIWMGILPCTLRWPI